ncbi:MAG: type II toxin-antitoxin system VapC family toxin [Candidatus Binatia bacterium]
MFLDTTIIVEVLRGNEEITSYVEGSAEKEPLMFSLVQIGEIADWCHANKLDTQKVISEVKAMATVVGLSEDICLEGSKIKHEQRQAGKGSFGLMDGLIAASAMSFEQKLLTRDKDFTDIENVVVL